MNKKFSQSEDMNKILSEFIELVKKDSEMPELSTSAQKELWIRIGKENKSNKRLLVKLLVWSGSIAASICFLLITHHYVFSPAQPEIVNYATVMQRFESMPETSGDVQLVLSNNRKITIEGEEAQLDYREEGWVDINQCEKMEVKKEVEDEKTVFNQLIVPVGKRSSLTFNDGTHVWINSGSKLVYPVNFTEQKREIFVDGEIYLEVRSDAERPFIVHTGVLDIKVLGTQFNVSAYADQSELKVVLVSGKVEIQQHNASMEILQPNQLFSYNELRHDFVVSTVDVSDYIAWKDGYYPFHQQDLGTVLAKLSNYYDVQFKWDMQIKELICSGKLDLKENLQEVFNTLEKTAPIKINKISEREYTVVLKH